MKRQLTEKELRCKAEAYCSGAEHSPSEVRIKLKQWGADDSLVDCILEKLFENRFLDTSRFCKAFVRDKYRFAGWGRMKIAQALRLKGLPDEDIAVGLDEIDEDEYADLLKNLLARKRESTSGRNEYERNAKLIRFAVGRGFRMDEVLRYVKQEEWDEFMD